MIYPLRKISHFGYKFLERGAWGELHPGVDLNSGPGNSDLGEPILAPAKGEITHVCKKAVKGWGKHFHLKIETPFGIRWCHFAHCEAIHHQVGDVVAEGQVIAKMGNTGGDWTAHLHFEIKKKPTGVGWYPNKKTTAEEIMDKFEDPLVFIDKCNEFVKEEETKEALEEKIGRLEKQLKENQAFIEGLKEEIENYRQFRNWLAEKLGCGNEIGVIKNEVVRLLEVENQNEKLDKEVKKINQEAVELVEEMSRRLGSAEVSKEAVFTALGEILASKNTLEGELKSVKNELEALKRKGGEEKMKKTKVLSLWNWLPKEAKVAVYMFGAAVLDQLARQLSPDALAFIPTAYRLFVFNMIEVFLVESAKRLKARRQK